MPTKKQAPRKKNQSKLKPDVLYVKKDETKEKYHRIYADYVISNCSEEKIAEKYKIDRSTVQRAIKYVTTSRLDIPTNQALQIGIDATRNRMFELKEDLDRTRKKKKEINKDGEEIEIEPDIGDVVKLQSELMKNQELLLKLQGLLIERLDVTSSELRGIRELSDDRLNKIVSEYESKLSGCNA